MNSSFRVIIFSDLSPRRVARLAARIEKEVPEAKVAGVVYQRQLIRSSPKLNGCSVNASSEAVLLGEPIAEKVSRPFNESEWLGGLFLRFIHACPAEPNGSGRFGLTELTRFCEGLGCRLVVTEDINSQDVESIVQSADADLGIVCGTLPYCELYRAPRNGSVRLGISEVNGRPRDQTFEHPEPFLSCEELRVVVHQIDVHGDQGLALYSESFPIEKFDTLTSLRLKSDLLGSDLFIRVVAGLAQGNLLEGGCRPVLESTVVERPSGGESELAPHHSSYRPQRGRPAWKLVLRTLLFGPFVVARNWIRRVRGTFPVIILFHHVVTDRPHHLGIPTELFLRQVEFLRKYYRIASLSEAIEMLKKGKVEAPTVVLTFDDGYRENFVNLRAVTDQFEVPATFFVCTDHITRKSEFQHDLMMGQLGFWPFTWKQVEYLGKNGCEIGSHTRTHMDCGSQDPEALEREIVGSKIDLEQHLNGPVRWFSFPWGQPVNMSPPAVALAKSTYAHSVSAFGGVNFPAPGADYSLLRRISHPNDLWELELALQSVLDF